MGKEAGRVRQAVARVLVVDDDRLVRVTIKLALQRAHHEVLEAQDGLEAIEAVDRSKVDVVVTDIIMPEVDGIGLILALRKRAPGMKVIAISGGGRTQNMDFLRMAKALGANLVLAKPFTAEEIQQAVDSVLTPEAPTDED
jgi:CheY-like chemotaxis protein